MFKSNHHSQRSTIMRCWKITIYYLPPLNPFDAASQRESCFTARTSRLAAALRCCHRSRSDASCRNIPLISVVKSLKQHSVFNTATSTAYHFTLSDSTTPRYLFFSPSGYFCTANLKIEAGSQTSSWKLGTLGRNPVVCQLPATLTSLRATTSSRSSGERCLGSKKNHLITKKDFEIQLLSICKQATVVLGNCGRCLGEQSWSNLSDVLGLT